MALTTNSAHVINPSICRGTGFDPVKDFAPVGLVASAGHVLVANSAFAAKSVADKLAAQGCEMLTGGSVKFAALISDDLPRWSKIVKDSGAQID